MSVPTAAVPGTAERRVGGVPFRVAEFHGAVEWVVSLAAGRHRGVNIRFLNAWNVALAHRDSGYRALVTQRGINLPDGMPVAWVLKLYDTDERADRIRGPSFFEEVMRQGISSNIRHYLLGGSPEVLAQLTRVLRDRYDGVRIVGAFAPPFAPLSQDYLRDCVERIRPAQPDLVWVGLGTPKQDYAGDELSAALGVPVLNVGAAFDFAAGAKRQAPAWMQRSGLEWLFRLASEPRRLWRRYLVGNVRFLIAVLVEWRSDRRR